MIADTTFTSGIRTAIHRISAAFGIGRRSARSHQELIALISKGRDEEFIRRLQCGIAPETINHPEAPSLIFWASLYRRPQLIQPLLDAGADLEFKRAWNSRLIRGADPFKPVRSAINDDANADGAWAFLARPVITGLNTNPASIFQDASPLLMLIGNRSIGEEMMASLRWRVLESSWLEDRREFLTWKTDRQTLFLNRLFLEPAIKPISTASPEYQTTMKACAALMRAGADYYPLLVYALITSRPDMLRLVIDNARSLNIKPSHVAHLVVHQDHLPDQDTLRQIVKLLISAPGGMEALTDPELIHLCAYTHSVDLLAILIELARSRGTLHAAVNSISCIPNASEAYQVFFPMLADAICRNFNPSTPLVKAIISSAGDMNWDDLSCGDVGNALRIVDLLLDAGASPGPALALMQLSVYPDHFGVNPNPRVMDKPGAQEILARLNRRALMAEVMPNGGAEGILSVSDRPKRRM